jgi:hypothetical protein
MKQAVAYLLIVLLAALDGPRASAQDTRVQAGAPVSARQFLAARALPGLPADEPLKCGLPLMAYARRNLAALPPDVQLSVLRMLQRDERQKRKTRGHFTVHYDTAGTRAAAMLDNEYQDIPGSANEYADSVLAIANRVYSLEIDTLGYLEPPGDAGEGGGPEYDIYVEDLSNEYGATTPELPLDTKPDGGRYTTYVVIDNDFSFVSPTANKGMPALRVTLAHEFHHMIQIGSYGYWSEDQFFYELTSTWMEDVVFPGVNDYVNYLRASWGNFRNPDISFGSNDIIMYSRSLWGHFIAAKFGRDVMRMSWDSVANHRPLQATDLALRAFSRGMSNFRSEFAGWVLWNYYTGSRADSARYYPKGALYPEIALNAAEFTPPSGMLTGTLQPLSARYYQVLTPADSGGVILIQANVNREASEVDSHADFAYSILLSNTLVDGSYEQAGNLVFFKSSVDDPSNWKIMKVVHGIASYAGFADGIPFPNPFRADGRNLVFIPAQASYGTLNIFSSSMDLVFSSYETPVSNYGKLLFTWNGATRGNRPAQSGIYLFVLTTPGKTITGKIALIRK